MTPLALAGLGVPELLIILAVVLLLFGGARLAGLGKSTGRALREFKEETKGLNEKSDDAPAQEQQRLEQQRLEQQRQEQAQAQQWQQPPTSNVNDVTDPSTNVRRDA